MSEDLENDMTGKESPLHWSGHDVWKYGALVAGVLFITAAIIGAGLMGYDAYSDKKEQDVTVLATTQADGAVPVEVEAVVDDESLTMSMTFMPDGSVVLTPAELPKPVLIEPTVRPEPDFSMIDAVITKVYVYPDADLDDLLCHIKEANVFCW